MVSRRLLAFGLFGAALCAYLIALPPAIAWQDTGLLAGAVAAYGLPHPPGFPSYLHLGHVFTLLTPGEPARGLSILSALAGAGSAVFVFRICLRALPTNAGHRIAAALTAALAYAFSYLPYSQAASPEQFAFTQFFILLALDTALGLEVSLAEARASWRIPARFALLAAALAVAGGAHPVAVVVLAPIALLALRRRAELAGRWTRVFGAIAGAGAGVVALYASLAGPAARMSELALADPALPGGLWKHISVSVLGYHGVYGDVAMPRGLMGVLGRLIGFSGSAWTALFFVAIAYGAVRHVRGDRWGFAAVASLAASVWIANAAALTANQEAALLPAQIAFAVWCAFGLEGLLHAAEESWSALRVRRASAIVPLLALLPLAASWRDLRRADLRLPERYARDHLEPLPRGAILASVSDLPEVFYLRQAQALRADVAHLRLMSVCAIPHARESFVRSAPSLRFDAFRTALARNPTDAASAFAALLVDNPATPVFATTELVGIARLPEKWRWSPCGLVLEALPPGRTPVPMPAASLPFERVGDDPVSPRDRELSHRMWWIRIVSAYARSFEHHRAAAEAAGRPDEARRLADRLAVIVRVISAERADLARRFPAPWIVEPQNPFGLHRR